MIRYYFGSPGAGKTTYAVHDCIKYKRNYKYAVSSFEMKVPGVYYDKRLNDRGFYGTMAYPRGTISFLDEASIVFHCRKYKSITEECVEYFKLHRHHGNDYCLYSQSWDDVDKILRDLSSELWYIKAIGPFTISRRVKKFIDTNTEYQIIDGYKFFSPLWSFLPFFGFPTFEVIYRPRYYKKFDTNELVKKIPIVDMSTLPRCNSDGSFSTLA